MPGAARDWIALVRQGQPSTKYSAYKYTNGAIDGSVTFTGLSSGTTYVARAFANGTYTQVGSDSASLAISGGGVVATIGASCSGAPCVAGNSITATYANMPSDAHSWVS